MATDPEEKPSGKGLGTIIVLAGLIVGIGLAGLLMRNPATTPGTIEFTLHQQHYQGIIAAVRRSGLHPGERKRFRERGDTLREIAPSETIANGDTAGVVWGETTKGGILMAVIETVDKGRSGESGYFYSSGPPSDGQPGWPVIMMGDVEWYVDSQLNGNWWAIYRHSPTLGAGH